MFNLDKAITAWRRQLKESGVTSANSLDELEAHLREEFETLTAGGRGDAESFRLAVSKLGAPAPLSAEYRKVDESCSRALQVWMLPWGGVMAALALSLGARVFRPGSPLLIAHVFCVTAGSLTVFWAGLAAASYAVRRWSRQAPRNWTVGLRGVVARLNWIALALLAAGIGLGSLWNGRTHGTYFGGTAPELGTMFAAGWLAAICLGQRWGRLSDRQTFCLCVVGNMVMMLGWFGAAMAAQRLPLTASWTLELALASQIVLLAMGAVPRPQRAAAG